MEHGQLGRARDGRRSSRRRLHTSTRARAAGSDCRDCRGRDSRGRCSRGCGTRGWPRRAASTCGESQTPPATVGLNAPDNLPVDLLARRDREREALQRAEVERGVGRAAAAGVVPEIVADHRFVQRLDAVETRARSTRATRCAARPLVALVGVVVREHLRAVAVQHEQVAVAADRRSWRWSARRAPAARRRTRSWCSPTNCSCRRTARRRRDGPCTRASGVLVPKRGARRRWTTKLQVAVVAIGDEAGREIAREGELLRTTCRCRPRSSRAAG